MRPTENNDRKKEMSALTIRSAVANNVKKVVEEEMDQGRRVSSSVLARMLSNADKAWAEYCHKTGIDRDTPLGTPLLPDDGSGEEYERAGWCCLPKDRTAASFVCQHGRYYPLQRQSKRKEATQPALDTWSQPYATSRHS
ncbi:hypothetical protein SMACR_01523 [Sordaria macrospora]|uniref:WGS project CABT00000000 data, contig 2.4 n=2 Tax=Sordaria macrospora TaxID=5147 RepID=F7VR27_SORMK|nr:uncharacterized protein SMAC_01523 [Sordaria macrospora k-hell]KAA8622165.1 hypothetical protein SMACR_01523 [Sordaria macrospora]WPJ58594.1 hypothetical protein SMAC4_01523 [Sordaria macrospora]CCC07960.1 unnamed protein product [Sordaria macrospora k-hell]